MVFPVPGLAPGSSNYTIQSFKYLMSQVKKGVNLPRNILDYVPTHEGSQCAPTYFRQCLVMSEIIKGVNLPPIYFR